MRKTWLVVFLSGLFLAVAVDFLRESGEGQGAYGFYAFFGFLGCVAIILVSKALGRYLLQREEDYYENEHRR